MMRAWGECQIGDGLRQIKGQLMIPDAGVLRMRAFIPSPQPGVFEIVWSTSAGSVVLCHDSLLDLLLWASCGER